MPAASSYTTQELIGMISVLSGDGWPSLSEIKNELLSRIDTDPESPTLGFVRPTKPNL